MNTVLNKHGVKFDADRYNLSSLPIENAKATGQFRYDAPPGSRQNHSGRKDSKLRLEDIKGWSHDQINARWKEIEPLLANSQH